MAKRKIPRDKLNRYLSLADPDFIGFSDDDQDVNRSADVTQQPQQPAINNLGATLAQRERERVSSEMAGGFLQQPPQTNTEVNPLSRNITNNNISTALATPQPRVERSSAPSFIPDEELSMGGLQLPDRVSRMNPLLFGRADVTRIARSMLQDRDASQPGATEQRGALQQIELTPEEKLAKRIAEINPTPRGFFKRLLFGALQGGAGITPDEIRSGDLSAFGRIVGGAVAGAFPAVDVANQREQQKRKAIEDYAIEAPAAASRQQRQKLEAERADLQLRREREERDRRDRARKDALDQAAQLRDDKRAEATQRLTALEKLGADSAKRGELVEELQRIYGINVDESYGLKESTASDKPMNEGEIRRRATSEVMSEIGASVEKIARDSANVKMQKQRDELSALVNDPNVGNVRKALAREQFEKAYEAQLKADLDYTKSDVENRIRAREQSLRGEFGATEERKQTTQPRSPRQSRGKGKVTQSNEASNTNFAQPGKSYTIK